jgi:nitrite reductase/ring-hydroxylating ferredoxin subunit
MKTVIVYWGNDRCSAYYKDGRVHVYDSLCSHYTIHHSLTVAQIKYVKGRANHG